MSSFRCGRTAAAILALLLICGAPGASFAQSGQTIESAHQFLALSLVKANAKYNLIDKFGGNSTWAPITSYSGSGCSSTIYARAEGGQTKVRRVDWTRITSVANTVGGLFMGESYPVIELAGPVVVGDGSSTDGLTFNVDSVVIDRIYKALEFIRSKCDPLAGSPW